MSVQQINCQAGNNNLCPRECYFLYLLCGFWIINELFTFNLRILEQRRTLTRRFGFDFRDANIAQRLHHFDARLIFRSFLFISIIFLISVFFYDKLYENHFLCSFTQNNKNMNIFKKHTKKHIHYSFPNLKPSIILLHSNFMSCLYTRSIENKETGAKNCFQS